uniref:Ig-like domain-containing protein n=1 Tax=Amphiprion ocellaris TaxID=80972 RepID=A0A3Q1CWQ0_AMPOC
MLRHNRVIFHLGFNCQQLTAVKNEESSLEGSTVTLTYNNSQQATGGDEFYWYRQDPGKPPEFLISHSASGTPILEKMSGLKIQVEEKQISMKISSAAVSDSAVYYCAVRPTGDTLC